MKILCAAAAAVLVLQGCANRESSSERIVCVPEYADVGSPFRIHTDSALGRWVEPELFVVTKIHGRTRHCARGDGPIMARAIPMSRAKAYFGKAGVPAPAPTRLRPVAIVEEGDAFPPGDLHLAIDTLRTLDGDETAGSLVVEFDEPRADGGEYYVAQARADCRTGALSVVRSTTFRRAEGPGEALKSTDHSPALRIVSPSDALSAAVSAMCEFNSSSPIQAQ